MTTKQPVWKLSANLGDSSVFEGWALLYHDETGVYSPELVLITCKDENDLCQVSRIVCDRCHPIGETGIGENEFHPNHPAWFSDKLAIVADCCGCSLDDLRISLCDPNEVNRAGAYQCLVSYFGEFEFDQYPVDMTEEEIRNRYPEAF